MRAISLWLIGLLAVPAAALAQTQTDAPKREPHPTMIAFLAELKNGELEKAAKRIASVNDSFGRQREYVYFTQAELVELLASCDLSSHRSLKTAVAIERTVWDCPNDQQYSMIFNAMEASNPYLYVHRIEAERARKAREEEMRKRFESGEMPPPPIALRPIVKPETRTDYEKRKRLEALEKAKKRDVVGEAVLSGDLDRLAEFTNEATNVAYITYDRYFDVKIKHVNGFGLPDALAVFRRAIEELGKPVSVECRLGEGRWPPQICEWQLDNRGNSMRAEMNFAGEGGSMNSIRVFRQTPEEAAELRQQAIDLGVIQG